MTLEWLLIVAAVAGFAAVGAYIVQRVVDDEIEVADDPTVLVLDAEIAAAFVATEAYEAALREAVTDPEEPTFVAPFKQRCEELATGDRFGAVVQNARFRHDNAAGNPYRCDLTFHDLATP